MKRHLPLLFAIIKFGMGLLLSGYGTYELQRDEYLYLDYGHHLAWGYLEVPPLTALQSWLTLALGGDYFWVKCWPLLWGSLTVFVVVRLARRLNGGTWAQVLAGLCFLATIFGRLNLLFQPNSFEVLTFTLGTYLLVRQAQPDGGPRHLYALGLVLGLGVLNKYTTFFFGAALGLALLLTPGRRVLRSRHFWLAAGLGLLVCGPNLLWQIRHGLPFRHHMDLLRQSQLVHVDSLGFWRAQLLMCSPALLVWMPGLVAALVGRPAPAARTVGWIYVGGLLLLTVLHGKNYYALGYYPALFAVGAVWWQQRLSESTSWGRAGRVALLLVPLLLQVPLLPYTYPMLGPARMARLDRLPFYQAAGVNRWEDGRAHGLPQDYADMLGWRELADKTWRAYQQLPAATRAATLIKCDNYGQAGAINYYNRHRPLPIATSFNGSYLFWFPARPAGGLKQLLLVGEGNPAELAPHFRTFAKVGEITNPDAREAGTTIYLGTEPDQALLNRAYAEHRAALAAWEGDSAR